MKNRVFGLMLTLLAIGLFVTSSIKAAPGNNPIFASIEFVQELFNQTWGATQDNESEIELLKQRVQELEDLHQSSESPGISGLFVVGETVDLEGFSRLIVDINSSNHLANAIFYSSDEVTWQLQSKFGEDFGAKSEYIFPVKARFYKISNWGPDREYSYSADYEDIDAPEASFTYTPATPIVNQGITFTDTSTGSVQRKWEFGSPYTNYKYGATEDLTPNQVGSFIVHLYVQNSEGVVDIASEQINVGN